MFSDFWTTFKSFVVHNKLVDFNLVFYKYFANAIVSYNANLPWFKMCYNVQLLCTVIVQCTYKYKLIERISEFVTLRTRKLRRLFDLYLNVTLSHRGLTIDFHSTYRKSLPQSYNACCNCHKKAWQFEQLNSVTICKACSSPKVMQSTNLSTITKACNFSIMFFISHSS